MSKVEAQRSLCRQFGAVYVASPEELKIGVAANVRSELRPLHGVRHLPEGDTTGWYVWAGEFSDAEDFFQPLHVAHLDEWEPSLHRFLGLAPGWRFLLVPEEGYEDVWFDETVLH
jgi:hypothetical protein